MTNLLCLLVYLPFLKFQSNFYKLVLTEGNNMKEEIQEFMKEYIQECMKELTHKYMKEFMKEMKSQCLLSIKEFYTQEDIAFLFSASLSTIDRWEELEDFPLPEKVGNIKRYDYKKAATWYRDTSDKEKLARLKTRKTL